MVVGLSLQQEQSTRATRPGRRASGLASCAVRALRPMNQASSVGHSELSGFIMRVSQRVTWTVVELRSCALRLLARAASPHLDPRSPVASLVPHTVTRHVKLSVARPLAAA